MNGVRTDQHRWTRALGLATGGVAALLLLTGCLSITSDMTINSDAKGTGTFALSLEKKAAQLMGITDLKSFASGIKQDSTPGAGSIMSDAKCDPSETADSFVFTCTFTNAEFTKTDELWTVTKANNQIVFAMKNSPSSGADTSQLTDLLGGGSLGDITVNLTFPGPIQSVTGAGVTKNSDTTATVKGSMTDSFDVTITSATSSGPKIGLIIAIVVGLLLLAAIVIGLVLFLVHRSNKRKAIDGAPVDAALADTAVPGGLPVATAGAVAVQETVATEADATPTAVVETVEETVAETPAEVVETVTDTVEDAGPQAPAPPA